MRILYDKTMLHFFVVPLFCFSQEKGEFYDYKSAFIQRDSVRSISIQCAFDNFRPTDGCYNIPDSIYFFKNLEYLSISETKVGQFPYTINKLKRLKTIHLGLNRKFNYNLELAKLVGIDSLEVLDLWMTDFKKLPNCVRQLTTLKKVGISFNNQINLKDAFKTLSFLPDLQYLNLSGTNNTIPKNIKLLKSLRIVELGYSRKINLKVCLRRLSKLNVEYLNLESNNLTRLPQQIGLLSNLEYLDLSNNYLMDFPEEIYKLKKLHTLNLENSGINANQIVEFKKRMPGCKIIFDTQFNIDLK